MLRKLVWEWALPSIEQSRVREIGDSLGIVFPDDYIACAATNHGGRPSLKLLDRSDGTQLEFMCLLPLSEGDDPTVLRTLEAVQDRIPPRVIPFAEDPTGDLFCFDFRGGSIPIVVYWEHEIAAEDPERALTKVCGTFTELLGMLYEEGEEQQ